MPDEARIGSARSSIPRSSRGSRGSPSLRKLVALLELSAIACLALALPGAHVDPRPSGPHAVARRSIAWRGGAIAAWYPARGDLLPVLLFSPGWGQAPADYDVLLGDVASQGYAVLAVPHRYRAPRDFVTNVGPLAGDLVAALDDATRARAAGDPLLARLELGRVGALGHSFGGAVAAEACTRDARVAAGMDLDGSIFGSALERGTPCPFFMLMAALPWWQRFARERPRFLVDRDQGYLHEERLFARSRTAYWLSVRGLAHMSFTDAGFFPRASGRVARRLGLRRGARQVHALTMRYVVAFFGRHLLGQAPAPELRVAPYPFARLRTKGG